MKQDYLSISVQDNGQGIPADQLDIIGYTTVTSTTGTGNALVNLNKRLTGLFWNNIGTKHSIFSIRHDCKLFNSI